MTVFVDSYTLTAYLKQADGTDYTFDLTPYAIKNPIILEWGIDGNSDLDNLASTGFMTFTLINQDGYFSPNNTNHLVGWKKGVTLDLQIVFDGEIYKRFVGTVDTIGLVDDDKTANVTVLDWIDYASKYPMINPQPATNLRTDQAIELVLDSIGKQPASTSFDVGTQTLSMVFDNTEQKTKAITEFSKINNSEPGKLYLRHNKTYGEQLRFENSKSRNGLRTLISYPKIKADNNQGYILNSTGGYILNSTGGKVKWMCQCTDIAIFDNTMIDITPVYGDGVINRITSTVYPKTYDTATTGSKVLFSLAQPIYVPARQTIEFEGSYSNPTTKKSCNAIPSSMLQPVAGYDLKAYSNSDTSGTNLTSYVSASVIYTTAAPKYRFTDTKGQGMWITTLQARGYGIYNDSPISAVTEDSYSASQLGYESAVLNQAYQKDLISARDFNNRLIEYEKTPRTKYTDVTFIANESNFLMNSNLNCDIGDLVHIKNSRYEIDDYFYIQKIRLEIEIGGIMILKWVLKHAFTLALGLSLVSCNFSASSTDALCYGSLAQITDLPEQTLTARIWLDPSYTAQTRNNIMSGWVDNQGALQLYVRDTGQLTFIQYHVGSGGQWRTAASSITPSQWVDVAVSVSNGGDPAMYIDGINQSITTITPVSGAVGSIKGMDWCIGNIHGTTTNNFVEPFIGKIRDVRVYNRILTNAEILAIHNNESVTDGLVFISPIVRTRELSEFDGLTLTDNTKILDGVYGAIGTANGTVEVSIN